MLSIIKNQETLKKLNSAFPIIKENFDSSTNKLNELSTYDIEINSISIQLPKYKEKDNLLQEYEKLNRVFNDTVFRQELYVLYGI